MFCGYACIVYSMRGDLAIAAPFIGIAFVLDSLDGRIARLTGTTSAFGVELDSLADVISFGIAPAVLAFAWGLGDLGRVGWAAGFIYLTRRGHAARAIQHPVVGAGRQAVLRRHAEPVGGRRGRRDGLRLAVSACPGRRARVTALAIVLVPAILMVSTIRFRSLQVDQLRLGDRRTRRSSRSRRCITFIAMEPRFTLVFLAYSYLLSPFIGMVVTRLRSRPPAVHHRQRHRNLRARPGRALEVDRAATARMT